MITKTNHSHLFYFVLIQVPLLSSKDAQGGPIIIEVTTQTAIEDYKKIVTGRVILTTKVSVTVTTVIATVTITAILIATVQWQ